MTPPILRVCRRQLPIPISSLLFKSEMPLHRIARTLRDLLSCSRRKISESPYLEGFSRILFKTATSTLLKSMHPLVVHLIQPSTTCRTLVLSTLLSRRTVLEQRSLSQQNQHGLEPTTPGLLQSVLSITTGSMSLRHIAGPLLTSFTTALHLHQTLSATMKTCVTVTARILSDWITAHYSSFHFSPRPCSLRLPRLRYRCQSGPLGPLDLGSQVSGQRRSVSIGIVGLVRALAGIGACMMSVLNVVPSTQPVMPHHAGRGSESESLPLLDERVRETIAGPKPFETAITSTSSQRASHVTGPRFRRGFVWSASSTVPHMSPAALYTETAAPLPSPPDFLVHDPIVQGALATLAPHIKVSTPFNIDRFESLLYCHPNRPFVDSVIRGL